MRYVVAEIEAGTNSALEAAQTAVHRARSKGGTWLIFRAVPAEISADDLAAYDDALVRKLAAACS